MIRALRIAMFAGVLALVSCSDLLGCSGDYLFQDWQAVADGGTGGVPYLDLSAAHFGPGQPFYIGACAYLADIESDADGTTGTLSFSHPNPPTTACIAKETTQTFVLGCGSLVVTTPAGSTAFAPPPAPADGD